MEGRLNATSTASKMSKYGVFPDPYLLRKSPYSVRVQENMDHKNSVFGHFSRSVV